MPEHPADDAVHRRLPVSAPRLLGNELAYVTDAVQSGWISSAGPYLDRFETTWAEHCDRRHGIAVSSGTAALELSIQALGLEPGSEIVMPSFTIISCALAAVRNGLVPVFVDCDPETWCMDPDAAATAVGPRTAAIMPVHIYGHPVDMEPIQALAQREGLVMIEDSAEAHGAEYRTGGHEGAWRPCGSFGQASVFSFYANKIVTTGEGGMVLTDDDEVARRCRRLRNLAFGIDRRFLHSELGHNYRMTNMQAALGLAQAERLSDTIQAKRRLADHYREALAPLDGLIQLPVERSWARSVYWMFGVVLNERAPTDATDLAAQLSATGIETRPFFVGMHQQPSLTSRSLTPFPCPVTERLAARGLYLPSGADLELAAVERVANALRVALT